MAQPLTSLPSEWISLFWAFLARGSSICGPTAHQKLSPGSLEATGFAGGGWVCAGRPIAFEHRKEVGASGWRRRAGCPGGGRRPRSQRPAFVGRPGNRHGELVAGAHARRRALPLASDVATLWTIACQAPLSMGFSRQGYWSGLPFPSPGDLPHLGMEPSISWVSCIGRRILYHCATWEALNMAPNMEAQKTPLWSTTL